MNPFQFIIRRYPLSWRIYHRPKCHVQSLRFQTRKPKIDQTCSSTPPSLHHTRLRMRLLLPSQSKLLCVIKIYSVQLPVATTIHDDRPLNMSTYLLNEMIRGILNLGSHIKFSFKQTCYLFRRAHNRSNKKKYLVLFHEVLMWNQPQIVLRSKLDVLYPTSGWQSSLGAGSVTQ